MWYVYVLKSKNREWYYAGSTNDISRRLREHNKGRVSSTKSRAPLVVVYIEKFENEEGARAREREIKNKRILKEKIIRGIKNNILRDHLMVG